MEQIIIIKHDGTKVPLFSKKNASYVSKASQKTALLSDDVVNISLTSAVPLDLGIGSYLTLYGKPYKLNQLLEPTKEGERRYTYELKLEGLQYDLIDVHYHLPENAYGETYYSDLEGHLKVLMWNINRIYPGKWVLGEYPKNTEYKNITNSGKNSLQVLQEFCSEYGVEFELATDGKKHTLNIKKKAGITHAFTLKYGRGKGLYSLQRKNVNNSGIITRLYVYGGTENLGSGYGHTRLCLPGTTRLTSYLEDKEAIALYGVKEGEKGYDIKPQRIGTVTALGKDIITFADSTMFDLNAKAADGKSTKYLIDGTSAKIKFESGGLAGYEFDLHSYDHSTKTFVINKFQDENGVVFPSETSSAFQIAVGDKYSISDIQLPDEFIDEAEKDLKEEGSKYLPTVSQPQVSYKLDLTEGFFSKLWGNEAETEILHVGDFINVEDKEIGVKKAVRITQIERNLLQRHSYEITLSDTITKTTTVRVWNELKEINEVIKINKLADPAKARRRWKATQELLSMVFDPEGDYYSDKIKPLSIETQMLSVGAKSTQFTLQNVMFQPNYGGNANTLYVSNGKLAHYAIDADGVKFWNMDGATFSNLTTATPYYIYARCSKTQATGNFILSETAKTVESEAGYYNFLVGVLNSVVTDTDGKNPGRLVSLTYGSSTINGRFIRTGRIESSGGGETYFDLDNGEIGGNIKIKAGSSGLHNLEEWEILNNQITALEKSVDETDKAVDDLGDYVDGAFADGIITEAEAKAIEKYINTVNNTKSAVEATYNKLYTNAYLEGTPKTNLLNAKVTLFGAIENLISSINSAIKDGKATEAEKKDVDAKFTTFNSALASFNTAVEAANKAIQDKLKGYSDECLAELDVLNDQITAQVKRVDSLTNRIDTAGWITTADGNRLYASKDLENGNTLISYINQAAGSTTIHSNKINLEGAVSFTSLNSSLQGTINGKVSSSDLGALAWRDAVEAAQLGSTIIVGGYLNTNYIKVNRIDANGARVGGFTIDNGRLYWKAKDYFGSDSRSLKLGVSTTDTDGVVDVSFNMATTGRFGVKACGANMGGAAIYGSRNSSGQTYPNMSNSYAGYFDGGVHVNGNVYSNTILSNEFGTNWSMDGGTYKYTKGISKRIYLDQYNYSFIEFANGIMVNTNK